MNRRPRLDMRVAVIFITAFSAGYILRTEEEKFREVTKKVSSSSQGHAIGLPVQIYCSQTQPMNRQFVPSAVDQLGKNHVSTEVFYVWCGPPRHFRFVNYASVMSILRVLQPETIRFFFENYPVIDKAMYYTWFDELLDYYPFLRAVQLNISESVKCKGKQPALDFIKDVAEKTGSIYVGENTIVSQRMYSILSHDVIDSLANDTRSGILKFASHKPSARTEEEPNVIREMCTIYNPLVSQSTYRCMSVFSEINPENIWTEHSPFGRIMRWAAYGSEAIKSPCRSPYPVVPNIGHMIWFGGKPLSFTFYLSILSVLYISGLDHLYLHGDVVPTGDFWEKVVDHPNLTFVHHSATQIVYGKEIRRIVHWADVVRVDILLRYGGVYLDTDVVFVQPLPQIFREYDAIVSYTFPYKWPQAFPNYINNGVLIGRPGAEFFQEYQRSMKPFIDWYFGWNGMLKPYKILERNPSLARLSHHLQLGCCDGLCHPTWWPEDKHRPWSRHHLNSGIPLCWWNESVTIHFMASCPTSLRSAGNLKKAHDMFGEIGRFILEKAGVASQLNQGYK